MVLGKCKLLGKSIKYQVVSIKKVVPSTKYQVGDSSNWMLVVFFIQKSKFGIRYFQFRTSYFVPRTFYFVPGTWYFVLFPKLHTDRIDAIANAAFVRGSIGEAVAQVTSAGSTKDLFSDHEVAVVHVYFYGLWPYGMGKTRPTAAAVVFEVRVENWVSTAFARVDACFLIERIGTSKGSFGSFLPQDLVRKGIQLVLPLFFGFLDRVLFRHKYQVFSTK